MSERSPFLTKPADMKQGMVVRMLRDGGKTVAWGDAFLDHTVVNVTETTVKLARPYVFVSSTDTSAPTPLIGLEQYAIQRTDSQEWLVVNDRNIAGTFTFEDIQAAEERGKAAAVKAMKA